MTPVVFVLMDDLRRWPCPNATCCRHAPPGISWQRDLQHGQAEPYGSGALAARGR
jgi:hypothetical protein